MVELRNAGLDPDRLGRLEIDGREAGTGQRPLECLGVRMLDVDVVARFASIRDASHDRRATLERRAAVRVLRQQGDLADRATDDSADDRCRIRPDDGDPEE